jgi:hypothetical protein
MFIPGLAGAWESDIFGKSHACGSGDCICQFFTLNWMFSQGIFNFLWFIQVGLIMWFCDSGNTVKIH